MVEGNSSCPPKGEDDDVDGGCTARAGTGEGVGTEEGDGTETGVGAGKDAGVAKEGWNASPGALGAGKDWVPNEESEPKGEGRETGCEPNVLSEGKSEVDGKDEVEGCGTVAKVGGEEEANGSVLEELSNAPNSNSSDAPPVDADTKPSNCSCSSISTTSNNFEKKN